MRPVPLLALLAALVAPAARANDSTGFLSTTGIGLTRTPDIAMLSEDLRVSRERIEVDYVFRNNGTAPITTMVVFPLPELDLRRDAVEANLNIPNRGAPNFLDFIVTVDGSPVAPAVEQRALVGERDVSEALRTAGLEFGRLLDSDDAAEAIGRLPMPSRAALRAAGATRRGPAGELPNWRLRTRFHWQQGFPPGQEVRVSHRYTPFTGVALLTRPAFPANGPLGRGADRQPATRRYCVDSGTQAALQALGRGRRRDTTYLGTEIEYVLTTARNWAGPIGRFRLTVDKGSPDAVLSLCWRGALRREGPTRFVFEARDWLPTEELRLAIIAVNE